MLMKLCLMSVVDLPQMMLVNLSSFAIALTKVKASGHSKGTTPIQGEHLGDDSPCFICY